MGKCLGINALCCLINLTAVSSFSTPLAYPRSLSLSSPSSSTAQRMSSGEDELAALRKKKEAFLAKKKKSDDAKDSGSATGEGGKAPFKSKGLAPITPPSARPSSPKKPSPRPTSPKSDEKKKPNVGSFDPSQASGEDYAADYNDENDLHIPNRIGFGTMSWGNEGRGFVPEGRLTKKMKRIGKFLPGDTQAAYNTLLEGGINFMDTSETYGCSMRSQGLSAEQMIGVFVEENFKESPITATKFGNSWTDILLNKGARMGSGSVLKALQRSCDRMEASSVELYQVQNPVLYPGGRSALADGLAMALDRGLCNYVGVCDMSNRQMKSMQRKLEKRGAQLTSNQFEFSLTNRRNEQRIEACKDIGVIPFAHTPLDGGLASGKYTASNPTGGKTGKKKYDFQTLDPFLPIHEAQEVVSGMVRTRLLKAFNDEKDMRNKDYKMRRMKGEFDRDITTTQVAINYVVAKGAVPIPGVNTLNQAQEVLGCVGWGLTAGEVAILDDAADGAEKNRPATPKKKFFIFGTKRRSTNVLDF